MAVPTENEGSSVKSARRTLEVLEFFAETHRAATVMEIARRLDYPQSSTSVLLAGLARLGYLDYAPVERSYRPTLRVMLLGAWQQETLLGDLTLLGMMEELRRRTGCSVLLGLRRQIHVQYILVLRPPGEPGMQEMRAGILRPVCRAAVGRALLMGLEEREVALLVRHANAEAAPEHRVAVPALLAGLRRDRLRGWAESEGAVTPGRSVLSVPLPSLPGHPPLALGLGWTLASMETARPRMLRALLEAVGRLREALSAGRHPVREWPEGGR